MNFSTLPRDERASIVRSYAAEGKGRREIARIVGAPSGSIDTLCSDYRIRTSAKPFSGGKHARVHPGWESEGAEFRRWISTMDRRFCKAMQAEIAA